MVVQADDGRVTLSGTVPTFYEATRAVDDAWAVGREDTVIADHQYTRALLLHWDGAAWSSVRGPSLKQSLNYLYGVSALSATDAWAVGVKSGHTLSLRWDGAAWSRVPSLTPSSSDVRSAALRSVSADSTTDAWAVAWGSFTMHWDGSSWSQVAAPSPGTGGYLFGVSAVSPTDAWAVGYYVDGFTTDTLLLHWNGTTWVMV